MSNSFFVESNQEEYINGKNIFIFVEQDRKLLMKRIEWMLKEANSNFELHGDANQHCHDVIIYFNNNKQSLPVVSFDNYLSDRLEYTENDGTERSTYLYNIKSIIKWHKVINNKGMVNEINRD